jgi:hypothetical protein
MCYKTAHKNERKYSIVWIVDAGRLTEHEERFSKKIKLIFLSSGKSWNSIRIPFRKGSGSLYGFG